MRSSVVEIGEDRGVMGTNTRMDWLSLLAFQAHSRRDLVQGVHFGLVSSHLILRVLGKEEGACQLV